VVELNFKRSYVSFVRLTVLSSSKLLYVDNNMRNYFNDPHYNS